MWSLAFGTGILSKLVVGAAGALELVFPAAGGAGFLAPQPALLPKLSLPKSTPPTSMRTKPMVAKAIMPATRPEKKAVFAGITSKTLLPRRDETSGID